MARTVKKTSKKTSKRKTSKKTAKKTAKKTSKKTGKKASKKTSKKVVKRTKASDNGQPSNIIDIKTGKKQYKSKAGSKAIKAAATVIPEHEIDLLKLFGDKEPFQGTRLNLTPARLRQRSETLLKQRDSVSLETMIRAFQLSRTMPDHIAHYSAGQEEPWTENMVINELNYKIRVFKLYVGCVSTLIESKVDLSLLSGAAVNRLLSAVRLLKTQTQQDGIMNGTEFTDKLLPHLNPENTKPLAYDQIIDELRNEQKGKAEKDSKKGTDEDELEVDFKFKLNKTAADLFNSIVKTGVVLQQWHDKQSCLENLLYRYGSAYSVGTPGDAKITSLKLGIDAFEKGHQVKVLVIDDLNAQEAEKQALGVKVFKIKGGGMICAQDKKVAAKFAKCAQKDLDELAVDFSPLWEAYFGDRKNLITHPKDPKAGTIEESQNDEPKKPVAKKTKTKSKAKAKKSDDGRVKPSEAIGGEDVPDDKQSRTFKKMADQIRKLDDELKLPATVRKELIGDAGVEQLPEILQDELNRLHADSDDMMSQLKEVIDDGDTALRSELTEKLKEVEGKGAYAHNMALSTFFDDD